MLTPKEIEEIKGFLDGTIPMTRGWAGIARSLLAHVEEERSSSRRLSPTHRRTRTHGNTKSQHHSQPKAELRKVHRYANHLPELSKTPLAVALKKLLDKLDDVDAKSKAISQHKIYRAELLEREKRSAGTA
ncbi:MAG TPA: hypothetical protein VGM92_06985 [Candidatus Kapabacteria bacterium]|jgi:hypothetical protein